MQQERAMGRGLVLIAVAVGTGLLIFWLAGPRYLSPGGAASHPLAPTDATAPPSGTGETAIAPPRTPEQKEHDALEAKRAPFYSQLRQDLDALLTDVGPAADDQATLVLYAQKGDDQTVDDLLVQAVQPQAYKYGFRHVRFYLPNPPGEIEKYRFAAEADADDSSVWHTFRK